MRAETTNLGEGGSRADFNGSGVVDFEDFVAFAQAYGSADARFDLDGSGMVDFGDFVVFASNYGAQVA